MPKLMSLFIPLFAGLAGGSSSLCVSVYRARPAKTFVQRDRIGLTSIQMLALHAVIVFSSSFLSK